MAKEQVVSATVEVDDFGDPGPAKVGQLPKNAKAEYTKAWLVSHPFYGSRRVYADDKAGAIAEYRRIKCPHLDDKGEQHLTIAELKFKPAATETDKPFGWKRPEILRAEAEVARKAHQAAKGKR